MEEDDAEMGDHRKWDNHGRGVAEIVTLETQI